MAVTLRDVAVHAGVSASAVSRAYTPGASVSAKTRAKVEAAAAELGYRPSILASALSTGRTKLIGLVANNFHNPVFLEVFDSFTRALQKRALRPLLVNLSDDMTRDAAVVLLHQYSVDGVVLASSTLPPTFPAAFEAAGLPVVHAFGRWSRSPAINVVGVDNRAAGRLAARTLAARGYESAAFLGGPEEATSTQDRLSGFREGLRDTGLAIGGVSFARSYSFESGRTEMTRLLGSGKPAEAYFCGDDILSIGAMSALKDAGLLVPEDVGVLGFNDMQMAGWSGIDLTTIRQPFPEIIEASIDRMSDMLARPHEEPTARLFACSVVERATLRPAH
ncbi:MAG: LacI family DNA-binding transcriptional regulator [Rhodobacteraceae bacterium]|nr:LacI family DNA-binding transcriptional regulator [Paracoccaceae bacterium]